MSDELKEELKEKLTEQWIEEVFDRADEVDPGSSEDWHSMLLGWGLAKGLSPDQAVSFASYIRYDTSYG